MLKIIENSFNEKVEGVRVIDIFEGKGEMGLEEM